MILLVGVLRYGLHWSLEEVQGFLHRTLDLPRLAFSTLAYLSTEYLVRWSLFSEERLLDLAGGFGDWVLQVDGTVEDGGTTTLVAREGRRGVILLARPVVSENKVDGFEFLSEVQARYGIPSQIVRDDGEALKASASIVFPGVPQQLDPYHFLVNAAKVLMRPEYEGVRRALIGDEGMARVVEWSRTLPCRAKGPGDMLRVVARLTVQGIDDARGSSGGFPFHRAYQEVMERIEWTLACLEASLHANARCLALDLSVLGELRRRLGQLVGREAVRVAWERFVPGARAWEGVREALKTERDRRKGGMESVAFTARDVAEAKRKILEEVGPRMCAAGDHASARWERFERMFHEQERHLWPEGVEERWTTVELERCHHRGQSGIRGRTEQSSTGREMGRVGGMLEEGLNLENGWFVVNGVMGRNLWQEFAGQDWPTVRERIAKVGKEGLRERVPVGWKRAGRSLERVYEILGKGGTGLEKELERWVDQEGLLEVHAASAPA